jgi:hypothetical protein
MIKLILGLFLAASSPEVEKPYVDEACAESFACQDIIIYELVYAGIVVSTGDMDEKECEAAKADIQKSTGAMSDLKCRPRLVERQKI